MAVWRVWRRARPVTFLADEASVPHSLSSVRSRASDKASRSLDVHADFNQAMRKLSVWVEPLFAEAKQLHGLRRFRLRGLVNVNIEALLVATGQNRKRWLQAIGWGHRWGPAGCLAAPNGQRLLLSWLPAPPSD